MRKTILVGLVAPWLGWAASAPSAQVEYFEKQVRPLLVNHCYACHSAETKPAGGLRVDDRRGLLRGGDSGPAVVPGAPEKSLLLARVKHGDPRRRMPEGGRCPERGADRGAGALDSRRRRLAGGSAGVAERGVGLDV